MCVCVFISGGVTAADMKRIADRMLSTKPSVAAYGSLSSLPSLDNIQKQLKSTDKNKRFSLFGN